MKQLLGKEENPLLKSTFKSAVCVALGLSFAPNGAPTASAQIVTNVPFEGDASALLNLDPTRTLAAVNFYDTGHAGVDQGGNFAVGTIQGVEFFDYDLHLIHSPGGALDNTPFNIGTGVHAGSGFTLTFDHPHEGDPARAFFHNVTDPLSSFRTQIGTFTPSADNTQAERWAQGGVYRQNPSPTVDTWMLDFGVANANKDVEINMLGGGIWANAAVNSTTHWTRQTVSVGGVDKAIFDDLGFKMYLATFPAQLDSDGKLDIVLTRSLHNGSTNWRFNIIAGFTVTEVGPTARFEITDIDYDAAAGTANVTWNSKPGRSYRVEWSNDLAPGGWNEDDDSVPASAAPATTTSYLFEGIPANTPMRFFRVWEQ